MKNCIDLDNQRTINDIKEYINNSLSNWYILQYINKDYEDNINHVDRAVKQCLENHIEDLLQENMYLKKQLDENKKMA